MEPPTMLTKADRNTRVMVNTPTRVLFILDRTIFLERVCSGAGKSCPRGRGREREREMKQNSMDSTYRHRGGSEGSPPLCLSPAEP